MTGRDGITAHRAPARPAARRHGRLRPGAQRRSRQPSSGPPEPSGRVDDPIGDAGRRPGRAGAAEDGDDDPDRSTVPRTASCLRGRAGRRRGADGGCRRLRGVGRGRPSMPHRPVRPARPPAGGRGGCSRRSDGVGAATTFGSDDPRAIPPSRPPGDGRVVADSTWRSRPDRRGAAARRGLRRRTTSPSSMAGVGAVDRVVRPTTAFWAGLPDAARSWSRRERAGGRLVGTPAVASVTSRWSIARRGPGRVDPAGRVALPASARAAEGSSIGWFRARPSPLLPRLLEGGFRIADRDTFMALAGPVPSTPPRLMPHPGLL